MKRRNRRIEGRKKRRKRGERGEREVDQSEII